MQEQKPRESVPKMIEALKEHKAMLENLDKLPPEERRRVENLQKAADMLLRFTNDSLEDDET